MSIHPIDPIYLWDGYTSRGFIDVEGATRFLLERWPDRRGLPYRDAAEACFAAMNGKGTTEDAREALLTAAEDAEILDRKAMAAAVAPSRPGSLRWRPKSAHS